MPINLLLVHYRLEAGFGLHNNTSDKIHRRRMQIHFQHRLDDLLLKTLRDMVQREAAAEETRPLVIDRELDVAGFGHKAAHYPRRRELKLVEIAG